MKRYRREVVKLLGAVGAGTLATTLLEKAFAQSVPAPERFISSFPEFVADVVVYRDGDYAVAVDKKGSTVARSTDHAEVLKVVLNMAGRIYVDAELEIDETLVVLKDNTHLVFSPRSKIVVVADIDHVLDIGSSDINNQVKPKNIVLKNIVIDAQGKANIGISVNMVDGLLAENIYVKDTKWMNIGVMGPARPKTMGDKQYLPDNVLFRHVVIENTVPPLSGTAHEVLMITGGAYGKVVFEDVYIRTDGVNRMGLVYIYENTQGRAETAILRNFTIVNGFMIIDTGVKRVFVEDGVIDASLIDETPLRIYPSGEEVDDNNPPNPSVSKLKVLRNVDIYGKTDVDRPAFVIETTSNVVIENVKAYSGSPPIIVLTDSWGYAPAANMENILLKAVKIGNNGQSVYKCGILVVNNASNGEIRNVVIDGIIDPAMDNDNIVFFDGGKVIRGVNIRARSLRPSNLYGIGGETTVKFYSNGGVVTVIGDGSTNTFEVDVDHGLVSDRAVCWASTTRPTSATPSDIYVYLVDKDSDGFRETARIVVRFDTAPANGEVVEIYWRCEVVG